MQRARRVEPIDELPKRKDLDSFPRAKSKYLPIARDDDVGTCGKGAFENPVIRSVPQHVYSSLGCNNPGQGRQV